MLETVMMSTREPLEWHFKQLDHAVGLSFKANFHFALVGHLLKGYRHPTPTTVSRTSRVLTMLLAIVAKPQRRDKFEVTPDSVAYLTGNSFREIDRLMNSSFFLSCIYGVYQKSCNRLCNVKILRTCTGMF